MLDDTMIAILQTKSAKDALILSQLSHDPQAECGFVYTLKDHSGNIIAEVIDRCSIKYKKPAGFKSKSKRKK
jgi:hypothetical protein